MENITAKAHWVTDKKTAELWKHLSERFQSGEFSLPPEELFLILHNCWTVIFDRILSKPLEFSNYFETLELPTPEYYYLLFLIASELDTEKEQQAVLFEVLEEKRHEIEPLVKQPLVIERKQAKPQQEADTNPAEELTALQGLDNNQITLLIFYALKGFGVKVDRSSTARFLHLLTGKPLEKLANSTFYKQLGSVPESKGRDKTLKDLSKVKELFKRFGLQESVNEIETAEQQVKNYESEA